MTDWDPKTFEDNLIADMRANDGMVTSGPLAGRPLLVMTSTGSASGQPRRAIVNFTRDGGDYVIAGSAAGRPTDPAWIRNVQTNPEVSVEVEGRTFEATAKVEEGPEHDRLWDQHVAAIPQFADYPEQSGRVIPMVRLTPKQG